MTPDLAFTTPSAHITAARKALARLQHHLDRAVGPLDPTTDLTTLAFANLTLETVNPPHPPLDADLLLELGAPTEPRADLAAAIAALKAASFDADTARETLRLAYVITDLRELENSPYLDATVHSDRGTQTW